jgi:hypothetical protein
MPEQQQQTRSIFSGCIGVVLVALVAVTLLFLWLWEAPEEEIKSPPPKPTTGTAEACAVPNAQTDVDCSAACGELSGRIRWNFDATERPAWERQYWRDCGQFGPPYETLAPPPP